MNTRKAQIWMIAPIMALLLCGAACKPEATAPAQTAAIAATAAPAAVPAAETDTPAAIQKTYQLGDKLDDFSLTLSDGTEVSLYGLLKEKKGVLLNFWASWCGPCTREFPYLEQAYDEMAGEIALIALSAEPADTDQLVLDLKKELGLKTLPMGLDTIGLKAALGVKNFPTSVMVDRNGVICFQRAGGIPDKDKFLRLFRIFTAEDYAEPVMVTEIPAAEPALASPTADALAGALKLSGGISVVIPEDKTLWPFIPDEGNAFVQAANESVKDSQAVLTLHVPAKANEALAYAYIADLSIGNDDFTVAVDGTLIKAYGGKSDWVEDYVKFDADGTHTVTFSFAHTVFGAEESVVRLRDCRLLSAEKVKALEAAKPAAPRTLPGDACSIEIAQGEARPAIITTHSAGRDNAYPYNILKSDQLTLRINIGEQINGDMTYVYFDGKFCLLNDLPQDSEGYYYTLAEPEPLPPEEPPAHSFGLYAPDSDGQYGGLNASWDWVPSESALVYYVETTQRELLEKGRLFYAISWAYQDDAAADAPGASAGDAGLCSYVITVTDGQGKPVEGAAIQICSADTCLLAHTDKAGQALHTGAPYPYEIHVLQASEGYAADAQTYMLPKNGGTLTIQLQKQ